MIKIIKFLIFIMKYNNSKQTNNSKYPILNKIIRNYNNKLNNFNTIMMKN